MGQQGTGNGNGDWGQVERAFVEPRLEASVSGEWASRGRGLSKMETGTSAQGEVNQACASPLVHRWCTCGLPWVLQVSGHLAVPRVSGTLHVSIHVRQFYIVQRVRPLGQCVGGTAEPGARVSTSSLSWGCMGGLAS